MPIFHEIENDTPEYHKEYEVRCKCDQCGEFIYKHEDWYEFEDANIHTGCMIDYVWDTYKRSGDD